MFCWSEFRGIFLGLCTRRTLFVAAFGRLRREAGSVPRESDSANLPLLPLRSPGDREGRR